MQRHRFPIIACVLKSGGEYKPEHVSYLYKQLKEAISIPFQFVCLSDIDFSLEKGILLPLKNNWPGWWSKIELFQFPGCTIYFDLDTMFYNSLDNFVKTVCDSGDQSFWMLKSFLPPTRGLSGIMAWNGDYRFIYDNFEYEKHSNQSKGDQGYVRNQMKKSTFPISFVQDSLEGVYSWKRNCKGTVPGNCTALVFHGKPRPWQVSQLWEEMKTKHQNSAIS